MHTKPWHRTTCTHAATWQRQSPRSTELLTYPFSGRNAITISPQDAVRLEHWEYLNDNLLEWYFRVLLIETCSHHASQVHIFHTHIYTRLKKSIEGKPKKGAAGESGAEPAVNQDFERVLRYCKNVDLFTKRLVIVPINENHHWYLAVIVNPGKLLSDPPTLSIAAAPEQAGPSVGQSVQNGGGDEGIEGMDTTPLAVDEDDDMGSAGDASRSNCVTPRGQSPTKHGNTTDHDSPTCLGFGSEAPSSSRLADTYLDGEMAIPAPDLYRRTKPGWWDPGDGLGEHLEDPTMPRALHAQHEHENVDPMRMDGDDDVVTAASAEPSVVAVSPKFASELEGAAGGHSTANEDPKSLSTTSLLPPSNIPCAATPVLAPVAPSTTQPESKPPTPAPSGAATPTAATTASSRPSTTSKDQQYDPSNDVLIVVLDSLNTARSVPASNLETYLKKLAIKRGYKVLENPPIRRPKPKSPRQPNSCDCGVYLLHYVERLLLDPDRMIQHYAHVPGVDTVSLWKEEEIPNKRVAIARMVIKYATLYQEQGKSKRSEQDENGHESDHDDDNQVVVRAVSVGCQRSQRVSGLAKVTLT